MGTRISAAVRVARVGVGRDEVQQRQRERGGLAGAGRGLAEHVAAGEQRRDRLALHRRRLFVAERRERVDEARIEAECGESRVLIVRAEVLWRVDVIGLMR